MLILALQGAGLSRLQAIVAGLMAVIVASLAFNLVLKPPDLETIAHGLAPDPAKLAKPYALYLAIGIIGATIMPHNLYLHSAVTRADGQAPELRRAAALNVLDTSLCLGLATLINGALLLLAASAFHSGGHTEVASIEEAHELLAPITGVALSSLVFAVGLLAAGQSSTITGTLAGQAWYGAPAHRRTGRRSMVL